MAALRVCVFVLESSPALLKPSACFPHSLCWPGPLGPPFPPTLYRDAPPPHPGSPPPGTFSSFLLLLILQRQSPPPHRHRRPPPLPLCPDWLIQCRWMTGKKACGVAQPGWEPGD